MQIRRIAILAMNPWADEGKFQPFSYGAYRNAAAACAERSLGDVDVRVYDTHGWPLDRWVDEVLAFDPDVVGCSSYVWSTPTFYTLAIELKARSPRIKIVFGGPSARPEMLALEPYSAATRCIDALVIGEGEASFPALLRAWRDDRPAASVPGLAVPDGDRFVRTAKRDPIPDLDAIPTPHQLGLAPRGVTAHMEPFRGCPMSCMFCQWGVQDGRRSMSRTAIEAELRAFKKSEATGLYLVDAGLNLNKRAFRALQEAEAEVGFIRDTELACEVYPAFLEQEHLEFLANTRAYAGLGLQSLDGNLLKNLDRPFDRKRFEKVVESICDVAQTTVELIVGLPGDTPEQFRRTFEQVRRLPCGLRVYHCLVLPDALLTRAPPSYKLDFDPITLEMRSCLGWSREDLMRTFDFLTEEVDKHGGTWTRYFPRPVEAQDLSYHIGRPIGSSMWMFPHAAHEEHHRSKKRGATGFVPEIAGRITEPEAAVANPAELPHASRLHRLIRRLVDRATNGAWRVDALILKDDGLEVRARTSTDTPVSLRADRSSADDAGGHTHAHGFAFRPGDTLTDDQRRNSARVIAMLAQTAARVDLLSPEASLRTTQTVSQR